MTELQNTRMITALSEVSAQYDAVFCDLWGCLHNGKTAFPAAVAALQQARRDGVFVMLLTNSPRPRASVIAQLDQIGVPRDAWDEVTTSGDAAQFGLLNGAVGRKIYHIGAPKDLPFFDTFADDLAEVAASQPKVTRVPLAEAEGIVCTGLRDDMVETPDDYRAELLEARSRGLKLLCANPDIMVDWGDKRIWCAGALAEAYQQAGGEALYFGKPWPPIYDLARRRLSRLQAKDDPQILCIGDGINTDILGAAGEGLDALFITGGLHAEFFGTDPAQPEVLKLQTWLEAEEKAPRFSIPFLA